jgi:hypothetical protein
MLGRGLAVRNKTAKLTDSECEHPTHTNLQFLSIDASGASAFGHHQWLLL